MRLILWFLAAAVAMLVSFALWGQAWEASWADDYGVAWLASWGSWAWLAGIVLLVADLVFPVPGTLVMSALGFIYGPWLGGLAAATGSFAAGMAGYGLCRALGPRAARWILGEQDLVRGRSWFSRFGVLLVAGSRALPIFPEIIACMAGLLRMPMANFALGLALGCLPMGLAFAWIGHLGHKDPTLAIALSLSVPAILWLAAKILGKRAQRSD